MKKHTEPKETVTHKKGDFILKNLDWIIDKGSPDCNVFTERANWHLPFRGFCVAAVYCELKAPKGNQG